MTSRVGAGSAETVREVNEASRVFGCGSDRLGDGVATGAEGAGVEAEGAAGAMSRMSARAAPAEDPGRPCAQSTNPPREASATTADTTDNAIQREDR